MPTNQENNIWEFEPGAANPLFFRIQPRNEGDTLILTGVRLKLTIKVGGQHHSIEAVWNAERQGYVLDTTPWASVIRQSKIMTGFVYMDWGDGWRSTGHMYMLPMEGETWQRSA